MDEWPVAKRHMPGMLLIGAAGRNAGKTELACRLIARERPGTPIVGVKTTTIHDPDAPCPRGGEGCGVCTSFRGTHALSEEDGAQPDKDTSRLLAAGAERVLWLRVARGCLAVGLQALVDEIGEDAVCICESNSLRHVVEPGVFLTVRHERDAGTKASCREVIHLTDDEFVSDGRDFTPAPERLVLRDGRWSYRREATAVVLAGGASRRMGCDKALLDLDGRPLIERLVRQLEPHFDEVIVSAERPDKYAFLGCRVIGDEQPGQGPLMGIASALAASRHDRNVFVPCDVPDLSLELVRRLFRESRDVDAVLPVIPDGRREPLVALYRQAMLPHARAALAQGRRRVVAMFEDAAVREIAIPERLRPHNLNTPDEYERTRLP